MEYNKLTAELAEELKTKVKGKMLLGEDIAEEYQHDEMPIYGTGMPDGVLLAADKEDIRTALMFCNEHKIPFVTRGAGTGLAGGSTPVAGGLVVDTGKLNKIIGYDFDNFLVTVEPGVFLHDLAADAEEKGYLYAPDPGEKYGTIGGNVSTNAGGMRAVKYGCTRDSVKSMKVMLVTGEEIEVGKTTAKNSSGYNLMHLMVGSEGTLGVVTEITLKLFPLVKENVSAIIPFEDLHTCIACVPEIMRANLKPVACELLSMPAVNMCEKYQEKVTFPHEVDGVEPQAFLITTFEADTTDELDLMIEKASEVVLEAGAMDMFLMETPAQKRDVWACRSCFYTALSEQVKLLDECDVVVPVTKMADYIEYAEKICGEIGLDFTVMGHAGDGNSHVYCSTMTLDEAEFKPLAEQFMDKLTAKGIEFGGAVSGEHGIGHTKIGYLEDSIGTTQIEIMKGIKKVFDPNMILNPGKVCYKL